MRQIIFFILILFLILGCTTKNEKTQTQTETETAATFENRKIQVDSIPAEELEKLIKIPIRDKFNEKYNGYYNITTNLVGDEILNGYFEFIHFDSSVMYNQALNEYDNSMISVSKIQYSGTFINGRKNGEFIERLLSDDGVDLYSKWTVSLDFEDNNCTKGKFTGIFGYIMPETTYKFENLDTCTFQSVVDSAAVSWKEEYEKRKN